MQIDWIEQYWKHDSSTRCNRDSDSNVINLTAFDLLSLSAKHDLPKISTEQGMQIDFSEQYWKHDSSIRCNLDSDSNVIDPIVFDVSS
jgi:hypothetical protein